MGPCAKFEKTPKVLLASGSWLLVFGLLTQGIAEAGTVHIRWPADAPKRLAEADVRLYEELVATRDADPVKFDHDHPFYGRFLANPTIAEALVRRWEGHEQRFEYWHPYLSRILDGISELPHQIPPPPIVGYLPSSGSSRSGEHSSPPSSGSGSNGSSGSGEKPSSTPEPSAWLMMAIGLAFVGVAITRPVLGR